MGLNFLPIVSINAEYIMHNYKKGEGDNYATHSFDDSISKYEHNSVVVSLCAFRPVEVLRKRILVDEKDFHLALIPNLAWAGLFFEPSLGYENKGQRPV